ncbi:AglZ/HisF2 family acetamidino modification protein [Pseudopedobacter beijingensis]|uniref:imidazole glycerol-phosphate synthase n=1 Tax=Pseudopedobacter beijingensis TaxID=1207056 RepID=A0ABW4I9W3_9SPHI
MLKARVIPVLLLHDNGLVKTRRFTDPVYVGDPVNAVKIFNLKEVDELIFLDINASKLNKEPDYELISDIAKEAFMPFGYGGGINKISQIRKLLRIGVEKIIINTALSDEHFVREAVATFGSSTIVASIDIDQESIYVHTKKKKQHCKLLEYVRKIEELGVGEIMVNSVERDGMYVGYNIPLLLQIASAVNLPVIGCGGARNIDDVKELITHTECQAAAAGSMFVFYGKFKAVLITYPEESELLNLGVS